MASDDLVARMGAEIKKVLSEVDTRITKMHEVIDKKFRYLQKTFIAKLDESLT